VRPVLVASVLLGSLLLWGCGYQLASAPSRLDQRGVRVEAPRQTNVGEPLISAAMEGCLVRELGRRGLRPRHRQSPRLESHLFALEEGQEFYAPRRVASLRLTLRFELRLRCASSQTTLWRSGMLTAHTRAAVSPDPGSSLAARSAALKEIGCAAGRLGAWALYGWRDPADLAKRCVISGKAAKRL